MMAVPTVTSISQAFGHTAGRQYVEIVGTNFRQQTPQVGVNGPAPVPPPSVRVVFGTVEATKVLVLSGTRLMAITAPSDEASNLDVVVTNIDDNGDPIAGETATLASAYNYRRMQFTSSSHLRTVVRALISRMRRDIHPNVRHTVNTDIDESTLTILNVAKIASLPAFMLVGPNIADSDAVYRDNANCRSLDDPVTDDFADTQGLKAKDVLFDLLLVSDNDTEMLNMANGVISFARITKGLVHPFTGDDIEIRLVTSPTVQPRPGNDNLLLARGEIALIGVMTGEVAGIPASAWIETGTKTLNDASALDIRPFAQLSSTGKPGTIVFEHPHPNPPFPKFP